MNIEESERPSAAVRVAETGRGWLLEESFAVHYLCDGPWTAIEVFADPNRAKIRARELFIAEFSRSEFSSVPAPGSPGHGGDVLRGVRSFRVRPI